MTRKDVIRCGGQSLFLYYPSLPHILRGVYPEFEWDATKFAEVTKPKKSWQRHSSQLEFMERIKSDLGVKQVPPPPSLPHNTNHTQHPFLSKFGHSWKIGIRYLERVLRRMEAMGCSTRIGICMNY